MENNEFGNFKHVHLNEERSVNSRDARKTRGLLPMINKIGSALGIKIIIDIPNGPFNDNESKVEKTVFLHINSHPKKYNKRIRRRPRTLFGQTISMDSPSLEEIVTNSGMHISSPENYLVGWILERDICIYSGVLEGLSIVENSKILSHILSWSLPYVVDPRQNDSYFKDCSEKYRDMKERSTHKLKEAKNKKSLKIDTRKFIMKGLQKRIMKSAADLESSRAKATAKKIDYFERLTRLVELEERLENVKKISETSDFAIEFEKIMGMEAVETLRIVQEEGVRKITINTRMISQFPDETSENRFDLGKYEIHINTSATDHCGIKFSQRRYRGPFAHVHASTEGSTTCFGTTAQAGLNNDIDKLMMDFDITPLIHLVITFLVKNSVPPTPRDPSPKKLIVDTISTYKNKEDKDKEKEEFIKICREEMHRRLAKSLEPDIASTKTILDSVAKERLSFDSVAKEAELNIQFLEGRIEEVGHLASSEVDKLLEDNGVLGLEILEDEIHIHFESPYAPEKSYESLIGYILRIKHDHPPELIFPSDTLIMYRIQLIPDSLKDKIKGDTTETNLTEKDMAKLQFQGEIAGLFDLVKKLIEKGICESFKSKPAPITGFPPQHWT